MNPERFEAGTIPGSTTTIRLDSGHDLHVFRPDGPVGDRVTATPILLVVPAATTSVEEASALAQSSGLASIASAEHGVVAILAPRGAHWQPEDVAGLAAAATTYVDSPARGVPSTNPGHPSRTYLFAAGAGADFVAQHVVSGIPMRSERQTNDREYPLQNWTPTAVWLSGGRARAASPAEGVEVPAYLVGVDAAVAASFESMNARHHLVASIPATAGDFARSDVLAGYDDLLEHVMSRNTQLHADEQVFEIPDDTARGIVVDERYLGVGEAPLRYLLYRDARLDDQPHPLVLAFHGGGDTAEYFMRTTDWPSVAQREGFYLAAVDGHVDRSPAEMIAVLDDLLEAFPGIDRRRVYATGFSMGSVKTWALGEQFTDRFAAIAPCNGSFAPAPDAPATALPTIYVAGVLSPAPELPHQQLDISREPRSANDIDDRLRGLFSRNGVADDWQFDESRDRLWGIDTNEPIDIVDRRFPEVVAHLRHIRSRDGQTLTAVAELDNAGHEALTVTAEVAWRFLARFARD